MNDPAPDGPISDEAVRDLLLRLDRAPFCDECHAAARMIRALTTPDIFLAGNEDLECPAYVVHLHGHHEVGTVEHVSVGRFLGARRYRITEAKRDGSISVVWADDPSPTPDVHTWTP